MSTPRCRSVYRPDLTVKKMLFINFFIYIVLHLKPSNFNPTLITKCMHYERPYSTRNYNMTVNGKRPKLEHFWAGMYMN